MEPSTCSYLIWMAFRILFISLIFLFLLSGLDDLFLDIAHYGRVLGRKLLRRKYIRPLKREQLAAVAEKPIAIMIPAWNESRIIQKMLLNTMHILDYENFRIFVGTYPNDAATALEVEKARELAAQIEIVITPADGPTNKADCLNWIYQGVRLYEKEHDIHFEALIMHDAEDIVHPLWLKMVNYLLPRIDFIQLPVFPLETPWYQLVSGVYKDEFAESHTKNMRAREFLAHCLPSAGVGTALSRRTVEWLAEQRNNQIFDIQSLTEDYLLGILLERMPGRKIFLQQWVEHRYRHRKWFGRGKRTVVTWKPVATREFFPNRFRAAVNQKSRWILGICLQGWSAGWTRSAGANYFLYRDRKALLANLIVPLGYVAALYWGVILVYNRLHPQSEIPPLIETSEIYFKFGVAVLIVFLWRIANRVAATTRIYGPLDGAMAIPRLVVANIINFCASVRAIYCFLHARISGQAPAWGKTDHVWPSEDQLRNYHRKLGDLLIANRVISAAQLEEALAIQQESGEMLGKILVRIGALWEEDILKALAVQEHRHAIEVDPCLHPELCAYVPRAIAEKYRIYPVSREGETLVLAREAGWDPDSEAELQRLLGETLSFLPATSADIDFGLRRGYGNHHNGGQRHERLGEHLLREGVVSERVLTGVLRQQKRNNRRLGDILVEMQLLSAADLQPHLDEMGI